MPTGWAHGGLRGQLAGAVVAVVQSAPPAPLEKGAVTISSLFVSAEMIVDYYCWLVWCERKILFWLIIHDRLRPSEQTIRRKPGWTLLAAALVDTGECSWQACANCSQSFSTRTEQETDQPWGLQSAMQGDECFAIVIPESRYGIRHQGALISW